MKNQPQWYWDNKDIPVYHTLCFGSVTFFDKFSPKNNKIGPIWILVTSVDLCGILEAPGFRLKGEGTIYLFFGSSCGKPGHEHLVGVFFLLLQIGDHR